MCGRSSTNTIMIIIYNIRPIRKLFPGITTTMHRYGTVGHIKYKNKTSHHIALTLGPCNYLSQFQRAQLLQYAQPNSRTHPNTVILIRPKASPAVLTVGTQDCIPRIKLRRRNAIIIREKLFPTLTSPISPHAHWRWGLSHRAI